MAAATLVVAWRTGANVHARQVKASRPVLEYLRQVAQASDAIVAAGGGGEYDPDDIQGDHPYMVVERSDVSDVSLEQELLRAGSLDVISADDLSRRSLVGYGLVLGDDLASREVYIKRYNPVQLLRKSLITRFSEELSRLEDPILAFDSKFDVHLSRTQVIAFDQANFEALFKDTEVVLRQVGVWVTDLAVSVPMTGASQTALAGMLQTNGILRRKLSSIRRRGHLPVLTASELKQALKAQGLKPKKFINKKGELTISSDNVKVVLGVFNEDLWDGYFSKERWSASYKSRR